MKKAVGLLLLLCLCWWGTSALAVSINVPATAVDAYEKFPSKMEKKMIKASLGREAFIILCR